MELGTRLRARRKALKMSGGQVAAHLGVSQVHISDMENNKRKPSLELLVRLARFYGVSTDYLLGLDEPQDGTEAVAPRDEYAEALQEIVGELSVGDKAALVELGRVLQRLAAERRQAEVFDFFLQMMEDVEREYGEAAAEEFYSALRGAALRGDFAAVWAWFGQNMRTPKEQVPESDEQQ